MQNLKFNLIINKYNVWILDKYEMLKQYAMAFDY